MRIATILEKIDENQLFVPAFQREYVWKRDDAKQLIDSLIKEYPTGTMLTWETASPPELKGPHRYDPRQGAVKLLLDGQQRVTTLYLLINGEIPPYYTQQDVVNNDTRGLHVNVETLELSYFVKTRMENNPSWQNITNVFKGKVSAFDLQERFAAAGRNLSMDELKKLNENINAITRIKDREFPEQTIPVKASIREAIDIFYKVNASGVALTDAELALAQISGYWPQARDLFKAKLAALKKEGFVFKLDFIVYVLLGCLYHLGSDMRKLHDAENDTKIRAAWDRLQGQVLDYVVNLMRTNAYVDHTDEINSPYALVPIIVYCFDKNGTHLTDVEIRKMVKWFFYSQVRTRYVSQLPQKLDRDLRVLQESSQPFDMLLRIIEEEGGRLEILPSEFVGHGVRHPLFSMMRWYFKSRGAVCLTTGLSLKKNMGPQYQLERDHIFPYSKLKEKGYSEGNRIKYALAQEMTNRAILTQIANRQKSAEPAEEYLKASKSNFPKALELQCIPEDPDLWKIANYEQFLEARRKTLASQLSGFLSNFTATEEPITPASLEDLIAEGESDELEFKATLRWDLREGATNKKLEDVIMKTVAAFANSQGGTLLMGVSDDGEVLGLETDYQSLGGADRDKFELHLRNLLNEQFGEAFVASRVAVQFHEVEDKEVCQVEVRPGSSPAIVKVRDKHGQVTEKLYVRSGNSSQELPLSEVDAYLKDRFHS